ncbi:alkaline phosphatase family protein [Planococcus faecalis]|uniref:alkaline phosphatase family protein n=1 Tax=Planococcus faecalis TaxID=1598147 RepID=UPI000AAED39F|nr:alkaline phosphatase family protein [Planococcus faecalis]
MATNRVVLIVIDALRFDTACSHMGYLQHLVEHEKAARYKVRSEVPSLSRPLYETILTGTPPVVHGLIAIERYGYPRNKVYSIWRKTAGEQRPLPPIIG